MLASARASFPAPGDLPSHSRRDVTTRRAHSSAFLKCVHGATIAPLSSSLGSYHNVESACPQFGRTSLPLLRTSGTDLSGSATLRPMGKRTPLLSSQWLCVSGCGDGERWGDYRSFQPPKGTYPAMCLDLEVRRVLHVPDPPSNAMARVLEPQPHESCKMSRLMLPLIGLFPFFSLLQGWVTLKCL